MQDLLGDYAGTVLLVSHDRDFIDRVATTTVAMEGDGRATLYAGGWTDYRGQRGEAVAPEAAEKAKPKADKSAPAPKAQSGLSFTQKHRLEELPGVIDRLEAEITKLEELLSDPELFTRDPVKFRKATEALEDRQGRLSAADEESLRLADKAEGAD